MNPINLKIYLDMKSESIPTRGRTLDHAAFIYDFVELLPMLGRQNEYDRRIVSLLELNLTDRVIRFRLRKRKIHKIVNGNTRLIN